MTRLVGLLCSCCLPNWRSTFDFFGLKRKLLGHRLYRVNLINLVYQSLLNRRLAIFLLVILLAYHCYFFMFLLSWMISSIGIIFINDEHCQISLLWESICCLIRPELVCVIDWFLRAIQICHLLLYNHEGFACCSSMLILLMRVGVRVVKGRVKFRGTDVAVVSNRNRPRIEILGQCIDKVLFPQVNLWRPV